MADKTIDELLDAIETVTILRDTIAKHDVLLQRFGERLEQIEKDVAALKAGRAARRP